MNLQLENKTALISGSTTGIGFAIAKKLAEEGAIVFVNGRSKEKVIDAIRRIQQHVAGAQVYGFAADFGNVNEVNAPG